MTGQEDENIIMALRVLILSIIPVTISLFYTDLRLIPFGYYAEFAKTRIISLIVYALLIVLLIISKRLSSVCFVWTIVMVESFVAFIAFFYCRERKIC
jgi:hypothetical protein